MIIRIVPDIFIDDKYHCTTISAVKEEFKRTSKFSKNYSWRNEFYNKIKCLGSNTLEDEEYNRIHKLIESSLRAGVTNKKSGHFFDLSPRDKKVVTTAIKCDYTMASGDTDLINYFEQEFEGKTISALGLLNLFIEKRLLTWSDDHQRILKEWQELNEKPQPKEEIIRFEKLTNYPYVGT